MIEPITRDAALYVAERMRVADRREIFATRWNDDPTDLADDAARCGFAWTAALEAPVAVVGAWPRHPGVWDVFMFATDDWPRVALSVTRHVRRVMIPALRATGAHRAQCLSIEGHDTAHRWLQSLGAKRESVLRQYGRNGEDFHLFHWSR